MARPRLARGRPILPQVPEASASQAGCYTGCRRTEPRGPAPPSNRLPAAPTSKCCSPLCPASTSQQRWLAEWTFGELPGFATWGPDSMEEAEDAHRCQFRDVTVSETTAAEARYLDNDRSDNTGAVSYCFERLF